MACLPPLSLYRTSGMIPAALLFILIPMIHAYSFRHGKATVTILSDGPLQSLDDSYSVPPVALLRSYSINKKPINPIRIQQNIVLLTLNRKRYLVDTGSLYAPEFGNLTAQAGRLPLALKKARVSPESISGIFLTHAHVDHVSGLVDSDLKPVFPNAKVYISRKDHSFWFADPVPPIEGVAPPLLSLISNIYKRSIKPYIRNLVLVEDGGSPLPGVTFIPTPGHSPGHSAIQIVSAGKRLLITGDTWVTEADQLQNPEWSFFLESNQIEAFQSRVALLEDLAKTKDLVIVYHEQFPGIGRVRQRGPFFTWQKARA